MWAGCFTSDTIQLMDSPSMFHCPLGKLYEDVMCNVQDLHQIQFETIKGTLLLDMLYLSSIFKY